MATITLKRGQVVYYLSRNREVVEARIDDFVNNKEWLLSVNGQEVLATYDQNVFYSRQKAERFASLSIGQIVYYVDKDEHVVREANLRRIMNDNIWCVSYDNETVLAMFGVGVFDSEEAANKVAIKRKQESDEREKSISESRKGGCESCGMPINSIGMCGCSRNF